jgi:hypothetical protein
MIFYMVVASAAYAQVIDAEGSITGAAFYSLPSTSVIDHNGNLLVFDTMNPVQAPLPRRPGILPIPSAVKTRLTVIPNTGGKMPPVDLDGSYQVLGVGRHAVYLIANTYTVSSVGSSPISVSLNRRLVAINLIAGIPLTPLPVVDVPLRADVRLSAPGDIGVADTIAFVEGASNPIILAPTVAPSIPVISRSAQLLKYSGGAAFDVGPKIPLP